MKNREKYEAEGGLTNKKRCKSGEFKDVDECVLTWLKQCRDKNIPVSGPILQEKAIQYAESLGKKDFCASNGWLHNFKKRNEIIFRKVCGESASVNSNVCDEWKTELKKLTESYLPENIYNADETGFFFKCLTDRTLSFKGDSCSGGKMSKVRITVLLCANSDGTDKLKPLVIGKAKNPRCFKNVKSLPTEYEANNKAWMVSGFFSSWLKNIDKAMKKKNRKILLFIDNCSAHKDIPPLKNVKVQFLPPNTTSKLQPLDQGIIKNFKVNYRREVVKRFLRDMDNESMTQINLLDALWMVSKAWNCVTSVTIKNCFNACGFEVPQHTTGNELDEVQDEPSIADINETPAEWTVAAQALNVEELAFVDFVDFDDDVAVCGELTDADIITSVA
ncbi:tigger transposable element-derived protein 6-like [Macrosteles quadrilineatus]|uniref:tigger transposable element-derived protein 6-like n=1 Tax=Macrosteles quadrilineatus TaxID=74068 RepID=UPI0023E2BCB9|nr:tigger transposable element-derived protein 6-like [Macrosteles quadrilineatus]